ncbi:MAG: hypothetical protein J6B20_01180 [Clostridia bacterium]|nr:hypothetical protein [Clostridia bacterium]
MEQPTVITIRTTPDALVKIYDDTRDEVIYVDNVDEENQTAPVTLPASGGHYFIDVTVFN